MFQEGKRGNLMKRIAAFLVTPFLLALTAGCVHAGQLPPTPPVYTAPPTNGTAYSPLNAPANNTVAASVTALSFSFTPTSIGTWCIVIQSWAIIAPASVYQDSVPSNVLCVTTTATDPVVDLSWSQPGNPSGYSYIISVAAATLVPAPNAPTQNSPTTVVLVDKSATEMLFKSFKETSAAY